jgi:hypothetical protein
MLLNKKNSNGSINLLQVTGEDSGETVSPLHENFRSQIEDGIWPIVSTLVDKGFYVVDSCQGHWDKDNNDYSHFTIAFSSVNSAAEFIKHVVILGVEFDICTSWIKVKNEVDFINKLYMTNHNRFIFVSIKILPSRSKFTKKLFTRLIRWRLLTKIKRINYEHIN